jgi:uncharacterized membrane protein
MNLRAATLLGLILAAVGLLVSAYHWSELPDPMPTHWDLHGHPNGYSPRWVGASLLPATIVALSLLWVVLYRISPVGYGLQRFQGAVGSTSFALNVFFLLMHLEALRAARTGTPLSVGLTTFGIGAVFLVLGNVMGKLRRNFFFGVRTPWTLADEEVWGRTHRLAGRVFVATGLLVMLLSLVGSHPLLWVPALMVAGLVPAVYSYLLYRRLHPTMRL